MYTCVSMQLPHIVAIILLLASSSYSVDKSNFKTCDQSGFCKRHRNIQPGHSPYYLEMTEFKISPSKLEGVLINSKNQVLFKLELVSLVNNMVRMKISELSPTRPRFEAEAALVEHPKEGSLQVISQDAEKLIVKCGSNKVVLNGNPFRLDVYSGDRLVVSANARGMMKFEHYRLKAPDEKPDAEKEEQNEIQQQPPVPQEEEPFKDTFWEESFKGRTDSKPYGPSSVGMDFSFVGFNHVYGIPEHADSFPLRQTKGSSDPYRLYNLDVFEYELHSPMALYGSIPLMVAHSESSTVGLFWLNAAETWVDIESSSNQGVVSSIVDFVKGSTPIPQQDTHWFSESGLIDVFFLLGPGPKDVMNQYAKLTGSTTLPPLFSLGYHQCRWNYRDQDDVRNVDSGFDEHDVPYDVLWLDLDHTHDRKYFTWDPYKFPNPAEMINNLTAKGRKMVTLVDPHIKRESNYFIDKEASDNDYYVKTKDNNVYQGWCWPGSSGYLDFLNPVIRDWWASKYALDQYKGSTLSLYTWNDMNEPSVFSEPEVTMPKDCKHYGGWEHRDIHNMYGMLMLHRCNRVSSSNRRPQENPVNSDGHSTTSSIQTSSSWDPLEMCDVDDNSESSDIKPGLGSLNTCEENNEITIYEPLLKWKLGALLQTIFQRESPKCGNLHFGDSSASTSNTLCVQQCTSPQNSVIHLANNQRISGHQQKFASQTSNKEHQISSAYANHTAHIHNVQIPNSQHQSNYVQSSHSSDIFSDSNPSPVDNYPIFQWCGVINPMSVFQVFFLTPSLFSI